MRKNLIVAGEMLLYGDVGDPWGWGDGFTPGDVAAALAEHGSGDLTVRINSGGGSAFDGVAIHSLLKDHAGAVTTVVDGIAASAASLIFMAGAGREMRQGAMLMIHDASAITLGPAELHRKTAEILDALSDQYAGVYAAASAGKAADLRAAMKAESWYGADAAIEAGLATASRADAAAPAAAFDWTIYAHAPAGLPARRRDRSPAALAALSQKEGIMPTKDPAAVDKPAVIPPAIVAATPPPPAPAPATPAPAAPAAKGWLASFYAAAEKANLPVADLNAIAAKVDTLEAAQAALIDAIHAARDGGKPGAGGPRIEVAADGRDKFRTGLAQAMLAQAGLDKPDPANEWNGIRPMAIVAECLAQAGLKAGRDPRRMVAMAITHAASDFPEITANVARKAMLKGYEEAEETFQLWTSKGSLTDFKPAKRIDLNAFTDLPVVPEGSEFTYLTTGERAELIFLVTAGGLFSITRQALINDDMDVFSRVPRRLGRAAKRAVGAAAYGVLTTNPNMADGVALFHAATHKNLGTGGGSALAGAALEAGDKAIGLQKDRTNPKVTLNLSPRHLIVPRALKFTALQLVKSAAEIGQANPAVMNKYQNLVDSVIAEARLDDASTTAWYLAADPNQTDTIEVAYLNGDENPFLDDEEGFTVDGMRWKVRLDYGVKALAWEGLYKANGA